jgi:hypothetical protein
MGRRGGVGILMAVARDVARQQRVAEAARVRAIREAERQERAPSENRHATSASAPKH